MGVEGEAMSASATDTPDLCAPELYFPQEGFGAIYRRRVLNEFMVELARETGAQSVAEAPLDTYGVPGAGSFVFSRLPCETTLISPHEELLSRAERAWRERLGVEPQTVQADPTDIPVADGAYDLTWSFDRLQAEPDREGVVAELARVSRNALIIIPNAWNYAQPGHWLYHLVARPPCDFVGPRKWMRHGTIRRALEANGMEVVRCGLIDVPWWPGFPELPDLVRRMLKPWGKRPVRDMDDVSLDETAVHELLRKAERATFIERSRTPQWLRAPFAHNLYVLARR